MNKKTVFFIICALSIFHTHTNEKQKLLEELLTKLACQALTSSAQDWWKACVFPEKKIVVVVASYNNSEWYTYNLGSIFAQNYTNYRVIYVDDCSPDGTAQLAETYVKEHHQEYRTTLVKNKTRQLAMKNLYEAISSCSNDEIVAILDGDDMFAHPYVLAHLNKTYCENNIWLTFGNVLFLSTAEICSWSMPVPPETVQQNTFREWQHGQTHLRTFYAWLFKKVKVEDLIYENEFFKMTYDVAMMLPMIEMAGDRHQFIKEVLYVYNDLNAINDHKVDQELQLFLNKHIRSKPKYSKLEVPAI